MKFVNFCCHGQSGHTLLAQIIDAHPDAVIGEEIGVGRRMIKRGWSVDRIKDSIYRSSNANARKCIEGRPSSSGSWRPELGRFSKFQGKVKEPEVIGDKMGWEVAGISSGRKETLLETLERRLEMPVYVIHAIRNPYDVIGAWHTGGKKRRANSIDELIDNFDYLVEKLHKTYYTPRWSRILVVANEEIRQAPVEKVKEIYNYLGLSIDEKLVKDVSSHVDPKISDKAKFVKWTDRHISKVNEIIKKYEYYGRYDES